MSEIIILHLSLWESFSRVNICWRWCVWMLLMMMNLADDWVMNLTLADIFLTSLCSLSSPGPPTLFIFTFAVLLECNWWRDDVAGYQSESDTHSGVSVSSFTVCSALASLTVTLGQLSRSKQHSAHTLSSQLHFTLHHTTTFSLAHVNYTRMIHQNFQM